MKTTVINLYGGPGSRKSTTAAHLFALLKHSGIVCELVQEWVKEDVWAGRPLQSQLTIFSRQLQRIQNCYEKVEYIITDSPILLSTIYGDTSKEFKDLVISENKKLNVVDIFINRVKPFEQAGRIHNEHEARAIDDRLKALLTFDYCVDGDTRAADAIFKIILSKEIKI